MTSTTSITETDTRSEYIAGLRALADLLEAHPEVQLPYGTGTSAWSDSQKVPFYFHDRESFDAFRRAFPGRLDKKVDATSGVFGFELHGAIRGLHVYAAINRDQVCRRVVTGTREVTRTVPITQTVGEEVVTETIEDVEWVCEPLLSSVTS